MKYVILDNTAINENYMKKIAILISFIISSEIFGQEIELINENYSIPNYNTQKLSSLCKIWGFLKYYHPSVAKWKGDWDSELTKMIKKVNNAKDKDELSTIYLDWIESLGKIKKCSSCEKYNYKETFNSNLDFSWMNSDVLLSQKLITTLVNIKNNRNVGKNKFIKTNIFIGNPKNKNENAYLDSVQPSYELRLIGLFRYWNVVNYFFPYKYLMSENWDQVLNDMIPKFSSAINSRQYHLVIMELTAKLDDGHARFRSPYAKDFFGNKNASFQCKFLDSKAVVTSQYNDSLSKIDDVRIGDVILKIDNKSINDIYQERKHYFGASNEAARWLYMRNVIFTGDKDTLNIQFERDGLLQHKTIHRYENNLLYNVWQPNKMPLSKIIDNVIGYVNMEALYRSQVKKTMKSLMQCRGIIFDLRGYPNGTYRKILAYLNDESRPFVKFSTPKIDYPGLYDFKTVYYTGYHSKNYFKGKVVILINETTQSHAEFTAMALKSTPNATIIGNNSAGADGDISLVTFPGGIKTYFSGIGVYFPDGRETQRIGLIPDIVCSPTISGIRENKDEQLERAIQFIKFGK